MVTKTLRSRIGFNQAQQKRGLPEAPIGGIRVL
jgi:hypothetical protein